MTNDKNATPPPPPPAAPAEPEGRPLTPHERAVLEPEVAKLREARQRAQELEVRLFGLLALAEPAMLQPESGLTFDLDALRFVRRADRE